MGGKEKADKVSEALLENYERLYRFAYSYVANEQDAMDIVQEAAYKAIRSCETLKNENYTVSWLFTIVRNLALDVQEKRKREQPGLIEEYLENKEEFIVQTQDDCGTELREALKLLEEKERTIIVLRFFEDKKLSEIAEIMGENTNTIKSRLYRALQKLRIELGDMAYFVG